MTESSWPIELLHWTDAEPALRLVRDEVFVHEQNIPPEEEWDALDRLSLHALVRTAEGEPIGCARLTPQRKIGRLAVRKPWRGRRIGQALLLAMIEQARARHWPEVALDAQVYATPFYASAGFIAEGPEFLDAGILHRHMRLRLDASEAASPGTAALPLLAAMPITTCEQARTLVDQLTASARHRLWIYSADLEPALYDRAEFCEELRRIALSGRGAEIKILLRDAKAAQRRGHRLLQLAARLPSHIHVRCPQLEEDRRDAAAFLLNDVGGLFWRPVAERWEGEGQWCAPGRQFALQQTFERVWQHAEPDPELRDLPL